MPSGKTISLGIPKSRAEDDPAKVISKLDECGGYRLLALDQGQAVRYVVDIEPDNEEEMIRGARSVGFRVLET